MAEPFRDPHDLLGTDADHERRISALEKKVVGSGAVPGTPSGIGPKVMVWNRSGTPTDGLVSTSYFPTEANAVLLIRATCTGVPTADATFDIQRNGTSMIDSPLTIAAGTQIGLFVTPLINTWLTDDLIQIVCLAMNGLTDPKVQIVFQ